MKFRKPDEGLVGLLEETLASFKAQKRRMFGSPVWFVKGNMFAGVHQEGIFLRLSEEDREELYGEYDEAAPFDPMGGRPMREYAVLPPAVYDHPESFGFWLERGYEYTASLPPKK